ncbi:MAG TPA: conjugal transfer protein TraI [Puia sp.]|nr:conjugal transfer protein TraI [Puia sp.]
MNRAVIMLRLMIRRPVVGRLVVGRLVAIWLMTATLVIMADRASAQPVVSIITEGITKVIRAVDLEIQRMQTKTIVLQEAQKELENAMSKLRLGEIQDWVEQQKDLYAGYFQELWQVKDVLSGYHRVSETIQREEQILAGCRQGVKVFQQSGHFNASELSLIASVYGGMLSESAKNLDVLLKAIQPYAFQITDQQRLAMIDEAAQNMDRTYRDMQVYTNENQLISLQRASDENDYNTLKKLYGL